MPSDAEIEGLIDRLGTEKEGLREREGAEDPNLEADSARIAEIDRDLEELWDLLRQRRALRDAGENPDGAHERSAELIERYWQ